MFCEIATTLRHADLIPPCEAGFLSTVRTGSEDAGRGVSRSDFVRLRRRASQLVQQYLEGFDPLRKESAPADRLALRFAEALVRQEEMRRSLDQLSAETAPVHARLSAAERNRVDDLVLFRGIRSPLATFDSLLRSWSNLVEHGKDGYSGVMFDEYVDWLMLRDALERASTMLQLVSLSRVRALLDPLDERFEATTRESARAVSERACWSALSWWWYRVPLEPDPGFARALDSLVRREQSATRCAASGSAYEATL